MILAQFLGMGLVFGASFLFVKIALVGVSFSQISWSRIILGGTVLGVICLFGRHRLPREPIVWLHFGVIAISGCIIPYTCFAWAEQYVSSGLASIYNAVTPIATALMVTVAFRVERLSRDQIVGVSVGILGVVVIIGPWALQSLQGNIWGQLACLAAGVSYGFTGAYTRRFLSGRPISGVPFAFMQIGLAAGMMILATPFVALAPVALSLPIVLSLITLGAFGTGLAYVWNINVFRVWGPTATSTFTYITPIVGVILGILVLGESLSWNQPVGAGLVFLGILLTQSRFRSRRPSAAPAVAPVLGPATEPPAAGA